MASQAPFSDSDSEIEIISESRASLSKPPSSKHLISDSTSTLKRKKRTASEIDLSSDKENETRGRRSNKVLGGEDRRHGKGTEARDYEDNDDDITESGVDAMKVLDGDISPRKRVRRELVSGEIGDGTGVDCLKGLVFGFTGQMLTLDREIAVNMIKCYGGSISSKLDQLDYVIVGSKISAQSTRTIQLHKLPTLNEDELFDFVEKAFRNAGVKITGEEGMVTAGHTVEQGGERELAMLEQSPEEIVPVSLASRDGMDFKPNQDISLNQIDGDGSEGSSDDFDLSDHKRRWRKRHMSENVKSLITPTTGQPPPPPVSPRSSTSSNPDNVVNTITPDSLAGITSSSQDDVNSVPASDFHDVFVPFVVKPGVELAPLNRYRDKSELIEVKVDCDDSITLSDSLRSLLSNVPEKRIPPYNPHPVPAISTEDLVEALHWGSWGATTNYPEMQEVARDRLKVPIKLTRFMEDEGEDEGMEWNGTWSVASAIVGPRNPFGRDEECIDYSGDSGRNWDNEVIRQANGARDGRNASEEIESSEEESCLGVDEDHEDDEWEQESDMEVDEDDEDEDIEGWDNGVDESDDGLSDGMEEVSDEDDVEEQPPKKRLFLAKTPKTTKPFSSHSTSTQRKNSQKVGSKKGKGKQVQSEDDASDSDGDRDSDSEGGRSDGKGRSRGAVKEKGKNESTSRPVGEVKITGERAERLNGRPEYYSQWTQTDWTNHNKAESLRVSKILKKTRVPCKEEGCDHFRDKKEGPGWRGRCSQCHWKWTTTPEQKKKEKKARQIKALGSGNKLKYVAPKAFVGIDPNFQDKNDHFALAALAFATTVDNRSAEQKRSFRRQKKSHDATKHLQAGRSLTYFCNPSDPNDPEIPIPAMHPEFPNQPLILDRLGRNNYRRIVHTLAKLNAETSFESPRPADCRKADGPCDWTKGDYVYVELEKRSDSIFVRYGDWSGGIHRDCQNKERAEKLAAKIAQDPNYRRKTKSSVEIAPSSRIQQMAVGVFNRNKQHELDIGVATKDTLLVAHGGQGEQASSAIGKVILQLPSTGGQANGLLLSQPGFNSRNKDAFQQKCDEFEETAKCFTCKRSLSLEVGHEQRDIGLPSIDRLDSTLPYFHSKQTLRLSCMGCQFGQADLTPEQRQNILLPLLADLESTSPLGDLALEYHELAMLSDEEINPAQKVRQKELRKTLKKSGVWSKSAAEKEWKDRVHAQVKLQRYRTVVEGRPGRTWTIEDGTERSDRQNWAGQGSSPEEHMEEAKEWFINSGSVCFVTGNASQILPGVEGGPAQAGLAVSIDRIFEDKLYDDGKCLPMLLYVNHFKASLPVFRTRDRWDKFMEDQPRLAKIEADHGLKAAVVEYLRVELAGGVPDGDYY